MSQNLDGADEGDLDAIRELVRAYPARGRHVVDLPYRLASHVARNPGNRRIWRDARGRVVAYALTQTPMWTLDCLLAEDVPDLQREVLEWGIARWRELAASGGPPLICLDVREEDTSRQKWLTDEGFTKLDWTQLHLSQAATARPTVAIPDGFVLRPLVGESEVEGYVALHRAAFDSENMTVAWRGQSLALPEYCRDLDLVAVAPDGRLAGFCIGWVAEVDGRIEGQIEPMGVHPDFQGHGLGQALLAEGLRRLQSAGAQQLHIEVDGDNEAARALYAAAGFSSTASILKYGLRV